MKKLFLAIATVAMVFATSCKNGNVNEPVNEGNIPENAFLCKIDPSTNPQNAPAVSDGMSTMANFDGNDVKWQKGDAITVYGATGNGEFTCSADPSNNAVFNGDDELTGPYRAVYPSSMNYDGTNLTLPNEIEFNDLRTAQFLPMYASSNSRTLTFSNVCAALKITVPTTCAKIQISAHEPIAGLSIINNGTLVIADKNSTDTAIVLKNEDTGTSIHGTGFSNGDIVYVALPAGSYTNVKFKLLGANDDSIYQTPAKSAMTVKVNCIYPVTINYNVVVPDLLPGEFSVASGKTVQFTSGNLLCDRSSGSTPYRYYFENSQIGYQTVCITANNPTTIGLFNWVTTESSASNTGDLGSYNSASFFSNGNISAGNTPTSQLRALTESEWEYLLGLGTNYRTNASSKRIVATVAGVTCLVVAPDDFTGTLNQTYTLQELNQNNLVCLPAAGLLYFNIVQNIGTGYYNTTGNKLLTFSSSQAPSLVDAELSFKSGFFHTISYVATPVRLVKDVSGN